MLLIYTMNVVISYILNFVIVFLPKKIYNCIIRGKKSIVFYMNAYAWTHPYLISKEKMGHIDISPLHLTNVEQ
jgi:hypothetical protein